MRKPKIIHYTWEDLTGLPELDVQDMEEIRILLRNMLATGDCIGHLRHFLKRHIKTIVFRPGSDLCVILCRLLEQEEPEKLIFTIAFSFEGVTVSLFQFLEMVKAAFINRPMPVVLGKKPPVYI